MRLPPKLRQELDHIQLASVGSTGSVYAVLTPHLKNDLTEDQVFQVTWNLKEGSHEMYDVLSGGDYHWR